MRPRLVAAVVWLAAATPAAAHPGDHHSGLVAGVMHPFGGADHLLAMVAVGLLGARLAPGRRWLLPALFVAAAGLGFAVARIMPAAGAVEGAVTGSVVALGLLLALPALPVAAVAALVAASGLAHGAAHGVEASGAATSFALGMLIATALLHAAGVAAGVLVRPGLVRLLGGVTAMAGVALAFA